MKLTKYTHACLVLEEQGQSLVIDPGNFTTDLEVPRTVVGVVITHGHGDHFDTQQLQRILSVNPQAEVYALPEIASSEGLVIHPVSPGQQITVGHFALEFTGGDHATIHPDLQPIGNVGVVVNSDLLYYPGDSFVQPPRHMKWIAVPVAAPWLKISEVVDFLRIAVPEYAFPTHDAILSETGLSLVDRVISGLIGTNISYKRISAKESIEL